MPKIDKPSAASDAQGTDQPTRTSPEPGKKYTTQGGETLKTLLEQAYGNHSSEALNALMGNTDS